MRALGWPEQPAGRGALPAGMIQEPHIIAVDDEPELREMLAKYLTQHGFSLAAAVAAARDVAGMRCAHPA